MGGGEEQDAKNHGILYHTNFSPHFAGHFNTAIHQMYASGLISIQGANSQMFREQGDTKIDLRSVHVELPDIQTPTLFEIRDNFFD